ncbi:MAG: YaaL family protein [Aeromonadales bacterium]|nr:YaaL family protein [Aeromonadales bacterium]
MQEFYKDENMIIEKNELEKEAELIRNIMETRKELECANKNFEFADSDLIDYYIYKVKANQAKLNYLIKMAKVNGINVNSIGNGEVFLPLSKSS